MVREYTKWDYELRAGQPVDEIVGRALDVALAQPRGPVYLTLPREVLADRDQVASQALPPTDHAAPQPSAKHIGEIAKLLARAELPVIVTANSAATLVQWARWRLWPSATQSRSRSPMRAA